MSEVERAASYPATRFAAYASAARAASGALALAAYPALAALIVNVAIPGTSQGAELVSSLADSPHRAAGIAILLCTAAYCATACYLAANLSLRPARRTAVPLAAPVAAVRELVATWIAFAVLLGTSAIAVPLPVVSAVVPGLVALAALALPLAGLRRAGRRGDTPAPAAPVRGAAIVLALGAVAGIAVTVAPVPVARVLGAWALVYLALGFWTLFATALFVALPRRFGLPALTFAPLLLFVAFGATNDNHAIRVRQDLDRTQAPAATTPLHARFERWLGVACARVPAGRSCPVVLVAADGGGTRSAYWTAAVLQALDDASRGAFGRHVFAISGVSGGALGAVAYVYARADGAARRGVPPAELRDFLADDYLSPIVGAMLFADFFQRFVPVPIPRFDRAIAFETALETSWRARFGSHRFEADLNDTFAAHAADGLPSLLLNATNVETGRRFVVSNLALEPQDRRDAYYAYDPDALYRIASMPSSTAVHLSARFPYVSPHGTLYGRPTPAAAAFARSLGQYVAAVVPWGRIVDGGYYENSGAATLSDVLRGLERDVARARPGSAVARARPAFTIVVISSSPDAPAPSPLGQEAAPPARPMEPTANLMHAAYRLGRSHREIPDGSLAGRSLRLDELLTPIEALFDVQGAHTNAELAHLAERVRDDSGPGMAGSPVQTFSYAAVASGDRLDRLMRGMNGGRSDDGTLVELIKPGLGWSLSPRSRHALDELSREAARTPPAGGVASILDLLARAEPAPTTRRPPPRRVSGAKPI